MFAFLIFHVLHGDNNIWVSWLVEVVKNWIIRVILLPVPLVSELLLGEVQTLEVLVDLVVSSEVWHEVVDIIAESLGLVLVLSAASRRADWIG